MLAKLSAEYNISIDNGYLVIVPKEGSILMKHVESVEFSNKTLLEAFEQLHLEKQGIVFSEPQQMGPSGPNGPKPIMRVSEIKIDHLKLSNVTLLDVLVKLGQSTKPACDWELGGRKGQRLLGFAVH